MSGTVTDEAKKVAAEVAARVADAVRQHVRLSPRAQQKEIGPSEIGHPCDRRLAYRLLDWPQVNNRTDLWPSFVGSAVHVALAEVFSHPRHNGRYNAEVRVEIGDGLAGSADVYDTVDSIVIDHKVVGSTSMRVYRTSGPSQQYRVQVHAYAAGQRKAGKPVRWVAIVFYPRGGMLTGLHVWAEPFNPQVVDAALDRLRNIAILADMLDVENRPEMWQVFPTDTSHCQFCPWYLPGSTDLSKGCPGAGPTRAATDVLAGISSTNLEGEGKTQ